MRKPSKNNCFVKICTFACLCKQSGDIISRVINHPFKQLLFIIIILIITLPEKNYAQQAPDMHFVDSITLELYNRQQWDELIVEGTKAFKNGIDYYYLRMRVGIARYETKNFRKSIPHFKKAFQFNPLSKITLEYLYFAYLSGGQPYNARLIEPRLSTEALEKNHISRPAIIEEVYVEGGPGFAGNQNIMARGKQHGKQNPDTIYNESHYYNNIYYGFAGVKIRLHPAISLFQGYGYLSAPITQKINSLNLPVDDYNNSTIQHEYYGNMQINLPGKIFVVTAFHKLWDDFGFRTNYYDTVNKALVFDTVYAKEQMYATSLSLKKDFSIFAAEVSGTYSDLGHAVQKQMSFSAFTFPFGNIDFYTKTSITRMWNDDDDHWIFYQMAGTSLGKNAWFETEFTYGQLRDYVENNAFVIYNSPEEINYKAEVTLIWDVSPHVELLIKYRYLERLNRYLTYTSFENFTLEDSNYPYHTIIGGIKWRF